MGRQRELCAHLGVTEAHLRNARFSERFSSELGEFVRQCQRCCSRLRVRLVEIVRTGHCRSRQAAFFLLKQATDDDDKLWLR